MERNNSHLAGEYFVAAELYRRGFSVGMTIGNAKAIDLFANKNNKTLSIQVKAIRNRKNVGWLIKKDKVIKDVLYIFVNLNDQANPDYYIATAKETKRKVKPNAMGGIINFTDLNSERFLNCWNKLELIEKRLKKAS